MDSLGGHGDDLGQFVDFIEFANIVILCFNLLPIYPLDGGQIVQSILWFFVGRATSLRIVAVVGLLAAAVGLVVALYYGKLMPGLVAIFIGWQSFQGYGAARLMAASEQHQRMQ